MVGKLQKRRAALRANPARGLKGKRNLKPRVEMVLELQAEMALEPRVEMALELLAGMVSKLRVETGLELQQAMGAGAPSSCVLATCSAAAGSQIAPSLKSHLI